MTAIILPDYWRRQPTGPVELRDDGLASGIVAIIAPVPGDPYRILGSGGLPLIRLGSGDIALRGDGASMAGVSLPVVLGDEISLFAAGRITRAAGIGVNVAVCSSAGDQFFGAQFSTTGGSSGRVLHRQSNGGTAAVLSYTAPQTVSFFDYATFGATSLDTGSSLSLQTYWQGQYDSAVNAPITGTNASYNRFSLGGAWRSSSSYAAAGNDMAIGIAFNRILSPAEYAALHENPWQVYKRSRRVLYFDVGGGGATPITTSDTLTPSLTEAQASLVSSSVTETLAPSLTEVAALFKNPEFITVTETLSVSVTEAIALLASSTLTDTLTPSLIESASLNTGAFEVDVTDGLTPSLTEAQTSLVSSAITEALTLTLGEVQGSLLSSSITDTFAISVSEAVTLLVANTVTDTLVVSITDTSGVATADVIAKEVSDALTPYFTELGALAYLDAWQMESLVVGVWTSSSANTGDWTEESSAAGTWSEESPL